MPGGDWLTEPREPSYYGHTRTETRTDKDGDDLRQAEARRGGAEQGRAEQRVGEENVEAGRR